MHNKKQKHAVQSVNGESIKSSVYINSAKNKCEKLQKIKRKFSFPNIDISICLVCGRSDNR